MKQNYKLEMQSKGSREDKSRATAVKHTGNQATHAWARRVGVATSTQKVVGETNTHIQFSRASGLNELFIVTHIFSGVANILCSSHM